MDYWFPLLNGVLYVCYAVHLTHHWAYLRLHRIIAPALKMKYSRITWRFVLSLYLIHSPFPYIPLQRDFLMTSVRYKLVDLFS